MAKIRKLVILRGCMGAGKSTWLKENDLEKFTLSTDSIRLQLRAPIIGIDGKETISQKENKHVFEILYDLLEQRMRKGEFTIIDAMHSRPSDFPKYFELAEKYRYRLYCVDFTDIPLETVKERNGKRPEYKRVPNDVIDSVYPRFENKEKLSKFTVVKPDEFFDKVLAEKPFDWNKYKNIHIFGDVHGCVEPLKEYFKRYPFNINDGYIFVGDYFDRGIQNVEVFDFIDNLKGLSNVLLLTGNHEKHVFDYSFGGQVRSREFMNKTSIQFAEAGITKSSLRGFYRSLGQIAYITFRGYDFIITHGGIPCLPKSSLDFYSTDLFVYGIGNYEDDIDEIFDNWAQKENETREHEIYQIHGHRNLQEYPIVHKEYSYNLEGKIEFGGELRVLRILDDGSFSPVVIKNTVFDGSLLRGKEDANKEQLNNKISSTGMFIQELRSSKYIQEKELNDGVSSFNFTRDAFDRGKWNSITTKARGLFIDVHNEKIQARSYNKFFNEDERQETQFASLVQNLEFPVYFYKKYNGFLGILSMRNDELYFCSKSTDEGDYVEYFKYAFYSNYSIEQIWAIKDKLKEEDATMVFEVIDPRNDPHIIEYKRTFLVLLDIIHNKMEFSKVKYEHLKTFGIRNGILVKELLYTVDDVPSFLELNNIIKTPDYRYEDKFIEGFVVEDSNGFMYKFKTDYYNIWKRLRNLMLRYLKHPDKVDELYEYEDVQKNSIKKNFLDFLRKKYPEGLEDANSSMIISERKDFVKNGGKEA